MAEKLDLRVIKTKRNIKTAFLHLLSEKSLNNITVQEILDHALINRTTFYKYYHDKYDWVEQFSQSCLTDISHFIEERFSCMNEMSSLEKVVQDLYEYIDNNRDLIVALWNIETDTIHLYKDIEQILKDNCFSHLSKNPNLIDSMSMDYFSTLYASVVLSTIRWILSQKQKVDVEKLFAETIRFVKSNILNNL